MSVKAMAWALDQVTEQPVDKLVLIALGNFADDANTCFPSRKTLAQIAMCSVDTVDRAIKRLEAAGMVSKGEREGARGQTSNVYTLSCDPSRNLRPLVTDTDATTPSRTDAAPQPQSAAPPAASECGPPSRNHAAPYEPSLEPSGEEEVTPPPPKGGVSPMDALRAFEAYNATALRCGLPQAAKLTPDRQRKIIARLRDYGPDGWDRALANIERSSFLTGTNDRGWRANLEFLLQAASFAKVHDGSFGNGRHTAPAPAKAPAPKFDPLAPEYQAHLEKLYAEQYQ